VHFLQVARVQARLGASAAAACCSGLLCRSCVSRRRAQMLYSREALNGNGQPWMVLECLDELAYANLIRLEIQPSDIPRASRSKETYESFQHRASQKIPNPKP
jgi:hypothetical protein